MLRDHANAAAMQGLDKYLAACGEMGECVNRGPASYIATAFEALSACERCDYKTPRIANILAGK